MKENRITQAELYELACRYAGFGTEPPVRERVNTIYGVLAENKQLRRENARLRKLYARWRRK